jgi:phosphoribosyl 1,2-cyclic phosphodiesterase
LFTEAFGRGGELFMVFDLKFWGVRGSIACPLMSHMTFGGNTSCIEMIVGEHRFILDSGTGIRGLGQVFAQDGVSDTKLLFTHTHWDHINGFPFFTPAYNPANSIHVMAGHLRKKNTSIKETLSTQMIGPMFPIPLEAMQGKLTFEDFDAGDSFDLYPDVKVKTAALNHPNDATGYRIEFEGYSACYVTDTEHLPGKLDENILGLIENADLVIYDSTYTEEEYPNRIGWGHSTWNEGMKLCQEAGAKRLAIFHHDPDHDDTFMANLEKEAQDVWDGNFVAREGSVINIAE